MVDSQRGTVKDLGKGYGGPPPLFWVKKEKITEGGKAGRASKTKTPPTPRPPLAQGLDPPLRQVALSWLYIIISYPTSASGIIVLLKIPPPKYRKLK